LPPSVVIEGVQLDGKPLTDDHGRVPSDLNLPPGKRQLNFRFTALSFAAPDKVRFRYRLTGFEEEWVDAENRRSAHYGPLPPGQYRFQVAACNSDGVWNLEGAALRLTQSPQFWQTWWFQGLVVMTSLGAIFGIVRFVATRRLHRKLEQLRQQRAVERERERIAKDIHDDLGAGLTQILLQSSLARRDTQGQVQTDFTQIADTARDLVRTMDEIVWAIDPENDTLDGLVTYLGKFVEDFVTSTGKRCRIVLPPQLPAHSFSADARHNLYLAVKEALNNAAKYSGAREISFQLELQPSAITFVVKDDGRGFDQSALNGGESGQPRLSSGHGLLNMTQRLESIGGTCAILSSPGQGTMVRLTLSLQNNRPRTDEKH
jgi:signal transduction histidine kinase